MFKFFRIGSTIGAVITGILSVIFFFVGFGNAIDFEGQRLLTGFQTARPFLGVLGSAIVASIVFYKLEKMEEQVKMHEYAIQQLRKELSKMKDPYARVSQNSNFTLEPQQELTPQPHQEIKNTTNTYGKLF